MYQIGILINYRHLGITTEIKGGEKISIDWGNVLNQPSGLNMNFKGMAVGDSHEVTFDKLTETTNGGIVADVSSETLEGDTLWLKGKFGFQNGCLSLLNASGKKQEIEGKTFTISKVESEKSPAGFAYRWQTV